MRKEFLKQVAERFFAETGGELRDYTFVFPNRRASLFFRKYLTTCADRPFFAPAVTNINDFFRQLSHLKPLDKIHLQYRLYKVFKSVMPEFRDSFDDFIYKADVVLGDFDDIDKYLVKAESLYSNIKDLKEIESKYDYLSENQRKAIEKFWNVFIPYKEGRKERSFMEIWDRLFEIYTEFRKDLVSDVKAYEGMIYRDVAEKIQSSDHSLQEKLNDCAHIVFVGLNAPNKCEKALFDYLYNIGIADFYWDYYGEVIRDSQNKSSLLMDENIRRYHSRYPLAEDGGLPDEKPYVEAIAVPSGVGQAKYVHTLLEQICEREGGGEDLFNTAILLPDESLLFPVLNSLPEQIEKVNVTMGYPLSNSGVSTFVRSLSRLHQIIKERDGELCFYHKNVVDVLSHPFIKAALGHEDTGMTIAAEILKNNIIYVPRSRFADNEVLKIVFAKIEIASDDDTPAALSQYFRNVLETVAPYLDKIDKEFILSYLKCLNMVGALEIPMLAQTFMTMLDRITDGISVPFSGEPLAGLQIMGPLEIRSLDFENLIILSSNEDTFPRASTAASLIPYNLRLGFELPTYELQDAVGAYHFYRSICRAKNVYMLYDSRTSGLRSAEESRYIKQLEMHHGHPVVHRDVSFSLGGRVCDGDVEVAKTDEDIELLRNLKYSCSTLQKYIKCPMQFYFEKVKGLKVDQEVTESLDEASFGRLYHGVMKYLYDRFNGKVVSADDIKSLMARKDLIEEAMSKTFKYEFNIEEVSGRNLIVSAVVEKLVLQTLKCDMSSAPFTMIGHELRKDMMFTTEAGNKVPFVCYIDRLQKASGMTTIIDYKTGKEKFSTAAVSSMFDPDLADTSAHLFQLMLYALIMKECGMLQKESDASLSVYYTKQIFDDKPGFVLPGEENYSAYRQCLSSLIDEILNPQVPFRVCQNARACSECPFVAHCKK